MGVAFCRAVELEEIVDKRRNDEVVDPVVQFQVDGMWLYN
jgi:hypothetical protein